MQHLSALPLFRSPRLAETMTSLPSTLNCKNKLPICGLILVILMLAAPFVGIIDNAEKTTENQSLELNIEQQKHFNQQSNYSQGDFSKGGFHKVTGAWWEPLNPYVPTVDDSDGDGVNNSLDSNPWNPYLPMLNPIDCTSGCEEGPSFSIAKTGKMLPFTEEDPDFSSITMADLGDMDRDGDLDLIFVVGYVVYFSENINGEFQNPLNENSWMMAWGADFTIGYLYDLSIVDLDGDGDLDIITPGWNGVGLVEMDGFEVVDRIEIGNYSSSDSLSYGEYNSMSVGDVNGDGLPDIALSHNNGTFITDTEIELFTNDYQGAGLSFERSWTRDVGDSFAVELTDINNDGYDDLLYSGTQADESLNWPSIYLHLGSADGLSQDFSTDWFFDNAAGSTIGYLTSIDSADLNNDGHLDLVVASGYRGFVLFNDGSGGVDVFPTSYSESNAYTSVFCSSDAGICGKKFILNNIVDINNDGLNDILYGESIFFNRGTDESMNKNSFRESNKFGDTGAKLLIGDLTGNSVMDIVSVPEDGPIAVYHQGGTILDDSVAQTLAPPTAPIFLSTYKGAVADLNNDGYPDIIQGEQGERYLGIYINDKSGGFSNTPTVLLDIYPKAWYYPNSIDVGDINGDGLPDIVVATADALMIFWNNLTSFFNNSNSKTIEDISGTGEGGNSWQDYDDVVIEDWDEDGQVEIAFELTDSPTSGPGNVARIIEYEENTDSFYVAWESTDANVWEAEEIKLLDIDGDGEDEFVRCLEESIEIYNRSGSYFSNTPRVISNVYGQSCLFMDATQDGTIDMVSMEGDSISVYLGPNFDYVVISRTIPGLESFDIFDIDQDMYPELIVGTSSNQKMRIHDITIAGIVGKIWEGGSYRDTIDFRMADFNGDGSIDLLQMNHWQQWDLIFGLQDTDYDSSPDEQDEYPLDPTQTEDSDNDGFGDSGSGRLSDNCPYYWGDSVEDKRGCPDQDGDGWSDLGDDFWRDSTQWKDTDGDGFGDNHDGSEERFQHWPGIYVPNASNPDPSPLDFDNDGWEDEGLSIAGWDDCPKQAGWSYEDRIGCVDTDYDGWSNNDDYWDQGDVFPNDITQWADTDGDGFGDNLNGTNGDEFPNDGCAVYDMDRDGLPDFIKTNCETSLVKDKDTDGDGFNNSMEMQLGTNPNNPESKPLDYDGDGVADIIDAFPEDPTEFRDRDKDGIGDNSDFCINKETNESLDCSDDGDNDGINDLVDQFPSDENEWIDSDGDGVGDNSDVWENDPEIWSDADGDGWADQFGHILTDDCPSLKGTSNIFMNGCSDLDEDGMPDILDPDIDGDDITNDNEMDASSGDLSFDPFDPESKPPDIDGDFIPDVLDHDRDGDGFPDEFEKERGSDYKDPENTPFNQYGNQDTGLFYVPGEGFKSQYDPEGVEISVSWLIDLITSELLVPLAMIPLTVFALMRKRRRYKKMRNRLEECKDLDMLKEYEDDIDDVVINRKVKVEHGMLLRNMFERMKEQFEDQEQVRLLGGKSSSGPGGMGRGGNMQQSGPMMPERLRKQGMGGPGGSPGPRRPGGRY